VPAEWADGVLDRPGRVFRPIALFGGSGCLIHRRVYAEAGQRYDESLTLGEDRDFLRRAGDIGPIAVCATPALRVHIGSDLGRSGLTSPEHDARRVRDHLILLERHYDARDDRDWQEATRWLVNRVARTGVSASVWRDLVTACRAHGWSIPAKARFRHLLRGVVGRGRDG
jgi:GT2 family glycosyltransferase